MGAATQGLLAASARQLFDEMPSPECGKVNTQTPDSASHQDIK
jgi:hypothetical protein